MTSRQYMKKYTALRAAYEQDRIGLDDLLEQIQTLAFESGEQFGQQENPREHRGKLIDILGGRGEYTEYYIEQYEDGTRIYSDGKGNYRYDYERPRYERDERHFKAYAKELEQRVLRLELDLEASRATSLRLREEQHHLDTKLASEAKRIGALKKKNTRLQSHIDVLTRENDGSRRVLRKRKVRHCD